MLIAHDPRVARLSRPVALAIGNFDGVHRGHLHIFQRVREAAERFQGTALALTFDPHPTRVLAPERASALLTGLDRKLELMAAAGLDATIVQRFDLSLSSQPAREFVETVLVPLRVREVFIGADFHFGHNREGNGALLRELGKTLGFVAHVIHPVTLDDQTISSSRIRRALAEGDLGVARAMLGRPFDLDGLVVMGHQRGRTLGFPTANLVTPCEALPRDGVYAVRVNVLGEDASRAQLAGVMNLGSRPTFRAGRSLEVHLLDTDQDLYGRTLRVTFFARLRDERRFDGIDALRAQIARDVDDARRALSAEETSS
jgi:riboflavin kinase/FMN adenylyltransferase